MKNIPKIIHQTWKSKEIPNKISECITTWQKLNPDFEHRFYDNEDCLQFVKKHYSQYVDAYLSLPKPVEKADFFRYLVINKYGGVYADIDTTCIKPINPLIHSRNEIIIGIEADFSELTLKILRTFGCFPTPRSPAYCQWIFISMPNHPILKEIIRRIAQNAHKEMDTLEKTGPAVWTDVVKKYQYLPGVRIVSKNHFGGGKVWPLHILGVNPPKTTYVLHHFASINIAWLSHGSWKNFHWKIIAGLIIVCVIAVLIIFL